MCSLRLIAANTWRTVDVFDSLYRAQRIEHIVIDTVTGEGEELRSGDETS